MQNLKIVQMTLIQDRADSQTENKPMVTKGEREGQIRRMKLMHTDYHT